MLIMKNHVSPHLISCTNFERSLHPKTFDSKASLFLTVCVVLIRAVVLTQKHIEVIKRFKFLNTSVCVAQPADGYGIEYNVNVPSSVVSP